MAVRQELAERNRREAGAAQPGEVLGHFNARSHAGKYCFAFQSQQPDLPREGDFSPIILYHIASIPCRASPVQRWLDLSASILATSGMRRRTTKPHEETPDRLVCRDLVACTVDWVNRRRAEVGSFGKHIRHEPFPRAKHLQSGRALYPFDRLPVGEMRP